MRSPLKISCDACIKRSSCTELCDRAREYSNQDYVPLREKILGRPASYGTYAELTRHSLDGGVVLNDRQLCIMVLVSSGVPRGSIRAAMKLSVDNLNTIISDIRRKYRKIGLEND
jgi:hypothetical protein